MFQQILTVKVVTVCQFQFLINAFELLAQFPQCIFHETVLWCIHSPLRLAISIIAPISILSMFNIPFSLVIAPSLYSIGMSIIVSLRLSIVWTRQNITDCREILLYNRLKYAKPNNITSLFLTPYLQTTEGQRQIFKHIVLVFLIDKLVNALKVVFSVEFRRHHVKFYKLIMAMSILVDILKT